MKVLFDESFEKSIRKIKDKGILKRINKTITKLEEENELEMITNVKKLKGFNTYYRIKIGDYRRGFEKLTQMKLL